MRIGVLTMCYNEEQILPFFLKHYSYVDEIRILFETDTTDRSLDIIRNFQNPRTKRIHIDGGIVDNIKSQMINDEFRRMGESGFDWIYVLDPDEFIYPHNHEDPERFLNRQVADVVYAHMWQVYRHITDKNLDPAKFPVGQRQHGDPDLYNSTEYTHKDKNSNSIKPSVIRGGTSLSLLPGNHQFNGQVNISNELYRGVHWQMADYKIAVDRRMARKRRISDLNRANRQGFQHFEVTSKIIGQQCIDHMNDPVLPIFDIPHLGFLKYISLEINDQCPLTINHPECPRCKDRFRTQPEQGEVTPAHMIDFVHLCMEYGFNGLITLHNYNEPMCTPDIVRQMVREFPDKISLWTSGVLLKVSEHQDIIDLCHDIMITEYPGVGFDPEVRRFDKVKVQNYPLDNRTGVAPDSLVDISIPRHCTRPNWEIILNNRGYLNACCGDWAGKIYFGNILTQDPLVILHRWNQWRKKMQIIQPWDTPEKQAMLHPACRECLARGTRIPMA
jgi:hypothetical protein